MAIYVDDIAVDWSDQPCESLGQVLQAAREKLAPAGRVVVEVVVEGESIVGDALAARQDEPVADRAVHLATAEPRELTIETLQQVREGLEKIRSDQAAAAEQLQADEPSEALQHVGEVLQSWLHVQEAVLHGAQLIDLDLDEMAVDGKPVKELTQELLDQFRELKVALTHGDFVAVADALAYEWPQTVDVWQRLLDTMVEQVRQGD